MNEGCQAPSIDEGRQAARFKIRCDAADTSEQETGADAPAGREHEPGRPEALTRLSHDSLRRYPECNSTSRLTKMTGDMR